MCRQVWRIESAAAWSWTVQVSDPTRMIAVRDAESYRARYLVGSPGGIAPPGSHGTERDSLPSLRSSHRIRQKALVHAQCLNRPGSRATRAVHQALKRLKLRNRLYFF